MEIGIENNLDDHLFFFAFKMKSSVLFSREVFYMSALTWDSIRGGIIRNTY